MKRRGIGSHTLPNEGQYTVYLTPLTILRFLGEFDLDPCAAPAPRPWPTAKRHIALPEDGLTAEWHGRVWLNPPYDGTIDLWLRRMAAHRNGIALVFARTETDHWQRLVWPYAEAILFLHGRLYFRLPDGSEMQGNAGGPSALIAYSQADVELIERSGLRGALVTVKSAPYPRNL